MQIAPVIHVNLGLTKISRRPFDGAAVPQQQSFAPPSIGGVYTKDGQIQRDPECPLGYKPIHDYV